MKRGYEIFPADLVDRLKEERKKKFDIEVCAPNSTWKGVYR